MAHFLAAISLDSRVIFSCWKHLETLGIWPHKLELKHDRDVFQDFLLGI